MHDKEIGHIWDSLRFLQVFGMAHGFSFHNTEKSLATDVGRDVNFKGLCINAKTLFLYATNAKEENKFDIICLLMLNVNKGLGV